MTDKVTSLSLAERMRTEAVRRMRAVADLLDHALRHHLPDLLQRLPLQQLAVFARFAAALPKPSER